MPAEYEGKWQYKVIFLGGSKHLLEVTLDTMGLDGWELVAVTSESLWYHGAYFFKRPKTRLILPDN